MNIPNESTMLVIVAANRYYLGRMTYAVSEWCEFLIAVWPALLDDVQNVIERDVMEEFRRDDKARRDRPALLSARFAGESVYIPVFPLGHDCDRAAWERVRALWKTPAPQTWEEVAKKIDDDLVNSLQGRPK